MKKHTTNSILKIDLKNIEGKWYQIERTKNDFQSDEDKKTKAFHRLMKNGNVEVVNETQRKGKKVKVKGEAKSQNIWNNHLKVFFSPNDKKGGDYYFLSTRFGNDSNDYMIVGGIDYEYVWILSRRKHMQEKYKNRAFNFLKQNGFDLNRFI